MEIIILIVLGAVLFFTYNGFATRCPNCGMYKLHSKDKKATKEDLERYEEYKKAGITNYFEGSSISVGEKPNYQTAKFKCSSCDYSFYRKEALIWLATANKLGEEVAIREYHKLHEKK